MSKGNRGYHYERYHCHYCGKDFPANRRGFHGGGRCVSQSQADRITAKRILTEALEAEKEPTP